MLIGNLILAFVTGLISSFGHCLGMCGGLVAIYSARQTAQAAAGASRPSVLARIVSLVPLHIGRITTYTFFGALIGLAGALLGQVGGLVGWQGLFSIFVGIVMIVIALSLMGVLPPIEVALAILTRGASPMGRMRGQIGRASCRERV